MARNQINRLVSFLVAVALLIFVLLSGISLNFGWESYLFLALLALVVYLMFLLVLYKSRKRVLRTEFQEEAVEPIIEYKSPAMEEFDKKVKEAEEEILEEDLCVGTEESKMYHKASCRFAKLVKPKYRVEGTKEFFKKKKFKACSVCKPNKK